MNLYCMNRDLHLNFEVPFLKTQGDLKKLVRVIPTKTIYIVFNFQSTYENFLMQSILERSVSWKFYCTAMWTVKLTLD